MSKAPLAFADEQVQSYLVAAGVRAVTLNRDSGKIVLRRGVNLARARSAIVGAVWFENDSAVRKVLRRLQHVRFDSTEAALNSLDRESVLLGLRSTAHDVAMERARRASAKLDALLSTAGARGDLAFFHREYRRRRLAAGGRFMSYGTALRRLRAALIRRAIAASPADKIELLVEVFDERRRRPEKKDVRLRGLRS